ncbi:type ISP restriction/modification enzyme [Mobilicoccus caccae]|nr:type ISP restriction/modification enzyme [Mobilicoccus caccae]
MRLTLAEEFSDIYVYNLRGNQRTAGEQSRKEGGKIFDAGSRATVAITVLVKDPTHTGSSRIHYTDIGDYLTRRQKLDLIAAASDITGLDAMDIAPNEHGDWLNQRRDDFPNFLPIGDKTATERIFVLSSAGLKTNRDAWVSGFSPARVESNIKKMVKFYNAEVDRIGGSSSTPNMDPSQFSWDRADRANLRRGRKYVLASDSLRRQTYRPFTRQAVWFDRTLNNTVYQLERLFPSSTVSNHGFWLSAPGCPAPFQTLLVEAIPDLVLGGAGNPGQFFARWRYEPVGMGAGEAMLSFDVADADDANVVDGYRRVDNVTDEALKKFRAAYGDRVTKDDIFDYCYGLLHSQDYREMYAADLKKMLPRIPLVIDPWPYVKAGRELAKLHLDYETVEPYPLEGLDVQPSGAVAWEFYRVEKMAFAKQRDPETKKLVADKSTIKYNGRITVSGIPEDAYRYMLGSRSAVEWIMDRYQVKTDKASGIVNDPNDWSREVGDPRYILDLLARIVTVSVETMKIVDALPLLDILDGPDSSTRD